MKGMRCRCGFATVSTKMKCPRCGKLMKSAEWADEGRVLSFTSLHAIPEGSQQPHDLVLVQLHKKGPKIVCWSSSKLKEGDIVSVTDIHGRYFCQPAKKLKPGVKR